MSSDLAQFVRAHCLRRVAEPTPRGALAFRAWQRLLPGDVPELPESVRAAGNKWVRNTMDMCKAAPPPSSVFGVSLNDCLRLEHFKEHPDDDTPMPKGNEATLVKRPLVPAVVTLLTELIKRHGGFQTEGMFRLAADQDDVAFFKDEINGGDYSCLREPPPLPPDQQDSRAAADRRSLRSSMSSGGDGDLPEDQLSTVKLTDVHVAAGLLKSWLRDLKEPLVPFALYSKAVLAGSSNDPADALAVVKALPPANQRTLRHLVAFMAELSQHHAVNRMDASNTAMVFAPNLLKDASSSAMQFAMQSEQERKFVEHLINSATWAWR